MAKLFHELTPKVLLRGESVVSLAAQREVVGVVPAVSGEGVDMMNFEAAYFSAALVAFVDERAARSVALEHAAPDSRRDMA
jgi:hypothetical protein